ncbi:MAG: ribosome-associated translation inhibitor RaiA [Clostridia bacterium]
MRIELTSKNYNEGSRLVEIIEKKLSRLGKFFDDNAVAKVKLTTMKGDKFTMEITVSQKGLPLVRAETTSGNMYDNVDILLPKLERQISKFRDRAAVRKKEGKPALPIDSHTPTAGVEKVGYGKVVKVKNFDISIITAEDAVAEMELLDHNFYVFVNGENNKVSVVYKRNDGDYGLITPEY